MERVHPGMPAPTLVVPLRHDQHHPLVHEPPYPACQVCVVIPVRDEAATLPQTLASLTQQRTLDDAPLDPNLFEVIVLANNCADTSAQLARCVGREYPWLHLHVVERTFPTLHAHVGYARRLLFDEACTRLAMCEPPCGVIASTDADTRVSPTWIAATLAEIARGADAVGGRILVDAGDLAASCPQVRKLHLQDVTYRWLASYLDAHLDPDPLDPWPRHFQHFGASLAVTGAAYRRTEGIPIQPWLEDVALADALARTGSHIRHSPLVQVTTSGRRTGRAGFGYAGQLAIWDTMGRLGKPVLVEPMASIVARATMRRQLRRLWQQQPSPALLARVATGLCVSPAWLAHHLESSPTFGAAIEVLGVPQISTFTSDTCSSLVDIAVAIRDLRAWRARHLAGDIGSSCAHLETVCGSSQNS